MTGEKNYHAEYFVGTSDFQRNGRATARNRRRSVDQIKTCPVITYCYYCTVIAVSVEDLLSVHAWAKRKNVTGLAERRDRWYRR